MKNENARSLYEPIFEHDNCGIGAIVSIDGIASRKIVSDALEIVERTQRAKLATAWALCFRFPTGFFRKPRLKSGLS